MNSCCSDQVCTMKCTKTTRRTQLYGFLSFVFKHVVILHNMRPAL